MPEPTSPDCGRAGTMGIRILIVEDEAELADFVVRGLREVDLPFGRILGFAPVRVEAEARARAPVRP